MKNFSLILFLLMFSLHIYGSSIGDPGISFDVQWECEQFNYNDAFSDPSKRVYSLPDKQTVLVTYKKNLLGKIVTHYEPDLFHKNLKFTDLTRKVTGKEKIVAVVDYTDCLEKFSQREFNALEKICSNSEHEACYQFYDQEIIQERIKEKNFFRNQTSLDLVPRFFPYHDTFYPYRERQEEYEQLLEDYCNTSLHSEEVTSFMLSESFLKLLERDFKNPASLYPLSCLQDILNLTETYSRENISCTGRNDLCQEIQNKQQKLLSLKSSAHTIRQTAVTELESQYLEQLNPSLSENEKTKFAEKIQEMEKNSTCSYHKLKIKNDGGNYLYIGENNQYFSEFIENHFDKLSYNCKKDMLRSFASTKAAYTPILNSPFCEKNGCEKIKKELEFAQDLVQQMAELIYGLDNQDLLCANPISLKQDHAQILESLGNLEEQFHCTPIKEGESRIMDTPGYNSPSSIEMRHLLEHPTEDSYKVTFNLNFTDNDTDGTITPVEMLNRTKECVTNLKNYLKGPKGETLELVVLSPDEVASLNFPDNKIPPKVNIDVGPNNMRSHSRSYASDAECGTIQHELMHLMGLTDEYEETDTQKIKDKKTGIETEYPKYVCRNLATTPSLMNDRWSLFKKALPYERTCYCDTPLCKKVLHSDNPKLISGYLRDYFVHTNISYGNKLEVELSSTYKSVDSISSSDIPAPTIVENIEDLFSFEYTIFSEDYAHPNRTEVIRKKTTINCKGDEKCKQELVLLKADVSNPDFSQRQYCTSGSIAPKSGNPNKDCVTDDQYTLDPENNSFVIRTFPRSDSSILHPGQFATIVNGECSLPGKITMYAECAKASYLNIYDKTKCPDQPEFCKDDQYWLDNKTFTP